MPNPVPTNGFNGPTGGPQSRNEITALLGQLYMDTEKLVDQARAVGREDLAGEVETLRAQAMGVLMKLEEFNLEDTVWITAPQPKKRALSQPSKGSDPSIAPAPSKLSQGASLLIIDDNTDDLEVLSEFLTMQGYTVITAQDGEFGLFEAQSRSVDLILLDLNLPGMSGIQVLEHLRNDIALRRVPVIMLSGGLQSEEVVKCIELGADDFLHKPVNPFLLRARVEAGLDRKRLSDMEQSYLSQLQAEQEKSERLLLNILPAPIAQRLKAGENKIADHFPEVTVLFADVVGFTAFSQQVPASELMFFLNQMFSAFDRLADAHELEKIKTIGDAYMAVGGLPMPRADHAEAVAGMALDMLEEIKKVNERNRTDFSIRIGINTGPVVAGVIGEKKFIYDLWGDTVNTASRMESHGRPGAIHVSASTHAKLIGKFSFEGRGTIEVKSKGQMVTYLLTGKLA